MKIYVGSHSLSTKLGNSFRTKERGAREVRSMRVEESQERCMIQGSGVPRACTTRRTVLVEGTGL